jgi:protocatechuate 3,4-dioxygenase beta subunit
MGISRRNVIIGGLASIWMAMKAGIARAQELLAPTGQETFGPFYPVRGPRGSDPDLTYYPGREGRAQGQVMELGGKVMDRSGKPLAGAEILIWQANAAGRYSNPVDTNPAPLDPGPYPEPSGTIRTPHIHFEVTHADYKLVTQMYFPGEALNETDILLSTLAARRRNPAQVICSEVASAAPGVLAFNWDIVLLA